MQKHCQIPTPIEYVKAMLNLAGYTKNLYGKKVLENSCGEGGILIEIVCRYIEDCRKNGYSDKVIAKGLQNDIKAYEIDRQCVQKCKAKLDALVTKMNLGKVKWNIKTADYLKSKIEHYDFIVGNPPYITYHLLTDAERLLLKKNFVTCAFGRFDYSYAFVEKSYKSLKSNGVMAYLIPYSIFRNKFAQRLRDMIKADLVSVIDYSGVNVFSDVTASAALIHIIKGSGKESLILEKSADDRQSIITKDKLNEKWFFAEGSSGKRFGDYFTVQNSVATLHNAAFLITKYDDGGDCVLVNGRRIEKSILRDAVSTKSCKKKNGSDKIIFPYHIHDGGYERISEAGMQRDYPETLNYLQQYTEELKNRKSSKGVLWYEYGRTQALKELSGEKLVISMVITKKVTTYMASTEAIPYAGYFIKAKNSDEYDLDFAKRLLETPAFYEYVTRVGTPTTETSFRISVKEIEDYMFTD